MQKLASIFALGLGLALPASAQKFIGIEWDGEIFDIDVPAGTVTLVGDLGFTGVSGMDRAPDGSIYLFNYNGAVQLFDPLTFALTPVLSVSSLFEGGLVFGATGEAWMCNGASAANPRLYNIDAALTTVTEVGVIGNQLGDYNGLIYRNDGMLVGMDRESDTLRVIDPATAAIVQEFPLTPTVGGSGGLDADEESAYLATGNTLGGSNELWSFDPFTGNHTLVMNLAPIAGTGLAALVRVDGGSIGSVFCSPANVNSSGQPARIEAFGSGVAGAVLTLFAADMPVNEFGYFLASQSTGFLPNAGGSQGNLCLALPIARFSASILNSGAAGSFPLLVDTNSIPLTPPVAVQAGETWTFQAWYRDQNPGPTSNFTDAVQITFN